MSRQPGRYSRRQRRACRPVYRDVWLGRASAPCLPCFPSAILDFVDFRLHKILRSAQWLEYAAHHGSDCAAYQLGKEYLRGKVVTRDAVKAMDYLTQSAEAGNQFAQYALGKLYLDRQDREQAHYWFSQSTVQGNEYAQFFLDRWNDLKPPSVMLSVTRLLHHMSEIFQDNSVPPQAPVGQQADRKLRIKIREKKIAMGHKADDHEEYNGPSMSM